MLSKPRTLSNHIGMPALGDRENWNKASSQQSELSCPVLRLAAFARREIQSHTKIFPFGERLCILGFLQFKLVLQEYNFLFTLLSTCSQERKSKPLALIQTTLEGGVTHC